MILMASLVSPLLVAATAGAPTLNPGLWRVVQEFGGGPMGARRTEERVCITPAQMAADPIAPMKPKPPSERDGQRPNCSVTEPLLAGGQASFSTRCEGPMGAFVGRWTGRYDGDSFKVSSRLRIAVFTIDGAVEGRRLGACSGE